MRRLLRLFSPTAPALALLLSVLLLAGGCASSSPTASTDRADVLGVWEYHASGSRQFLERGVFKIVLDKRGRLDGVMRDSRVGTVDLDEVRLRNGELHLRIEYFSAFSPSGSSIRISGRVDDGTYTGTFGRPLYDVTSSQDYRRRQSRLSGSIFARRVQAGGATAIEDPFGCTRGLVEENYDCQ